MTFLCYKYLLVHLRMEDLVYLFCQNRIVVLVFVAVLFMRDFLVAFKEENIEEKKEAKIEKAGRVISIMIVLNVLTVGYAILYYLFSINIEQVVGAVLQGWINEIIKLYPNKAN